MPSGSTLGLIPAKGGSTRLAQKNVRLLGGRPLIAWAAEAARGSGVIDRLVLSTEDERVAAEAHALSIDVPFMRPDVLAKDPAGVSDVALHTLDELEKAGETYETIVILLPTCPFRTAGDVRAAYELFVGRGRPFLMSVSEFTHTPFAAFTLTNEGNMEPLFVDYRQQRSQTLPTTFRPNGAVHVLDVAKFRASRDYMADPLVGYPMPRERSFDIDTEDDIREAELFLTLSAERSGAKASGD